MSKEYRTIPGLVRHIELFDPDIVVVEGYNGVGKSRILGALHVAFDAPIYRPPYNTWSKEIPAQYRWSIFSSFVDIVNRLDMVDDVKLRRPLLFDRGYFSGVVYNNLDLRKYYTSIIGDLKILNVLVTCDEESYRKFLKVRGSEKDLVYEDCEYYTNLYRAAFNSVGADYVVFINEYDEGVAERDSQTCRGCSHYNLGDSRCKHPAMNNILVNSTDPRCEHTSEKEVQDIGELQTVLS